MLPDDHYSTYDAKARFSEVLRRVREGRTVTVTYHGEPVAEIRPIGKTSGLAARVEDLRRRGVLSAPGSSPGAAPPAEPPGERRAGALERFLAERGD